ncbi:NAD-dependent aldehyde dehydrogenase [Fusarium verticillioides 7600]|uniref:NAD-dependent aldehyde dehydrogenase n=1 Tax=Gibberella moniliformis (strain M3125 / FGSC 7600) TaxID=334819 RepID=W7M512_GIBM7|nr:NAD-dependent aldehyde dehydrogenase [Fusarium verticillioides 7600]EWG42599.1 NAD-dependent aldehyde dehydrogenase [Fusarium verticillioides 7600]
MTGGYPGDQAEYCRVPNADLTCVKAPKDIEASKLVSLADVTPTAWHGNELAERLAKLRAASKVYAIDKDEHRLDIAKSMGMIPINVKDHSDPADYILSIEPYGLDRGIEASGFRSTNSAAHATMRALGVEGDSSDTVSAAIKAMPKGGNVALIGDFFYNTNNFPIGMLMEKGITLRGGQLYAQKYFPLLLGLVVEGKYDPSFMFTHHDKFENISKNYDAFFSHKTPGGLKVCLSTAFGREQGRGSV